MKRSFRFIRSSFYSFPNSKSNYWCPVCEKSFRRFLDVRSEDGQEVRHGAKCPYCNTLERHRFVWRFFYLKTNLFDRGQRRMLHVAPEPFFQQKLKNAIGSGYLSADLNDPQAMVRMDITKIDYPDETFNVIYCSHVLEHVPDDLTALKELHRVLSNDGWAVFLVPITAEETIEDPTVTSPNERRKKFGQTDHVRRYGKDFSYRIQQSGFTDKIYEVPDLFSSEDAERMGLTEASGEIYFCTKKQLKG